MTEVQQVRDLKPAVFDDDQIIAMLASAIKTGKMTLVGCDNHFGQYHEISYTLEDVYAPIDEWQEIMMRLAAQRGEPLKDPPRYLERMTMMVPAGVFAWVVKYMRSHEASQHVDWAAAEAKAKAVPVQMLDEAIGKQARTV